MRETMLRPGILALALLAFGWGLRLLFVFATPDAAWPYSFAFKGDAIEFLRQASWLLGIAPEYELGVPLRPPGNGYLVAWSWDGKTGSIPLLRHIWIAMGAAVAPVLYLTARGTLTDRVALIAGCGTAAATGTLLLSASLSNETPYLLGATASTGVLASIRGATRRRALWLAVWSAAQAVLCLLRAEHALFFVAGLLWASAGPGRWQGTGAGLLAFAAALLPWQLAAHRAIHALNTGDARLVYHTDWSGDAVAAVEAMPRFARQSTILFVEGTRRVRGSQGAVAVADLDILREAYDYVPEPLTTWPFVALHGGMNFYLANHPAAAGGFTRAPLFTPPPLRGGPDRYPPGLALPRDLALSYPPHLRILNDGYALGLQVIAADLPGWLGRAGRKLDRAWQGAAHGLGGGAIPLGMSGVRRKVDLVVPEGSWAPIWRALLLAAMLCGAWQAIGVGAARPWLLWIATRLVVIVLFFGYARQGALLVPALGVLLGLLCERYWNRWIPRVGLTLLAAVLAAEVYRFAAPPEITVDGAVVTAGEPDPTAKSTADRAIVVR